MRAKILRVTYFVLCLGMALVALQWNLDGWRARLPGTSFRHFLFFALDALLFATALAVLLRWRIKGWLAGISGAVLIVYALSVLTMGWEDVGGASGAIPLALPTAILGGWSIAVAINAWLEKGEAV